MKFGSKNLVFLTGAFFFLMSATAFAAVSVRLQNHVPNLQIASAQHLGRKNSADKMQLAITMKPRDPEALEALLKRLYDPSDSLYHQFLTAAEFKANFAPTDQDISQTVQYLTSRGLTVTKVHENNLVIDVEADTATVESAFQIEMHNYIAKDGRHVNSTTSDPVMSDDIAKKISSVAGLDSFALYKTHHRPAALLSPKAASGHASINDYMTPAKIKSGYNLTGISATGSNETIALFELDGYTASDISTYTTNFNLTEPTLQNILVDGATGTPSSTTNANSGAGEVTLDIELAIAVASGVSKILVYEGPNNTQSIIDTYNKIAVDNLAKEVSTSWGLTEDDQSTATLNSENTIFQTMASQGQSIFAAAGDSGAYDNGSTLSVDDPASQPYVTGVGGTTLTLTVGNLYSSESSWGTTTSSGGGGGGISNIWTIPTWQAGLGTTANKGSASYRMVPDVSLDANPNTGYAIAFGGSWYVFGGTSCAAPLWAAYTALINQTRVTASLSRLGFVNPSLYQIGQSSIGATDFHDIADGTTNLYYPTVTGYDLATGLGSFNGLNLYNVLKGSTLPPYPPSTVTASPGNLSATITWSTASGATSYNVLRSTSSTGTFTTVASGQTGTSYTDTVTAGTYYYYVTATNSVGTSGASAIKSATATINAPGAPTGLNATVTQ